VVSRGESPVWGLGDFPQKLKLFVKLHIIFALKYNKQQLLLLLDKITSKILGGNITTDVPLHKYWGRHVPPVP